MPTLTIEQIGIENPRTLILRDHAGPIDAITWGVRQRSSRRWIAGNPAASMQLFGPEDKDTEMAFLWRDADLGARVLAATSDGPRITTADQLRAVVDQMTRTETAVIVTWRDQEKIGILKEFDPTESTFGQIDASILFEWIQNVAAPPAIPTVTPNPSGVLSELSEIWNDALTLAIIPATTLTSFVDRAQASVNRVNEKLRRVESVIETNRQAITDSKAVLRGVGATLGQTSNETQAYRTEQQYGPELAGSDDPAAIIKGNAWQGRTSKAHQKAGHKAAREQRRFVVAGDPDLAGLYFVKTGDDLRLIALRFYGRADAWTAIAGRNALAGPRINTPQSIVLPQEGFQRQAA